MIWLVVILFGVLAGVLTTVTGLGGGLLLVIALAMVFDPVTALSGTALGLLIGNLHRVALYRRELSGRTALPVVLGAVPGAVIAGLVVAWLPAWLVFSVMVGIGLVGLVRELGAKWTVPTWAGAPVGLITGIISASSGGGGVIVAPYVLARGHAGASYVGTIALIAACMHVARIAAYGAGGATGWEAIQLGVILAVALPLGNLAGHAVRVRLEPRVERALQLGIVAVSLLAAGVGLGRDLLEPADDFPPSAVAGSVAQ